MSINRLVTSAILLIALLVVSSGGYIEITKLFTVRQLATSALRLDAIRALGNIPRYLNPERALFTLALQTAPRGSIASPPSCYV